MSRERKLRNEKRGGSTRETETETDETSSTDKHANVLSTSLNADTDQHDDGTTENRPSSTKAVASVGSKGKSADTTDRLFASQHAGQAMLSGRSTYLNSVENAEQ